MKRTLVGALCALLLCFVSTSRAESFDDLWKQVEQFERKGLPKSAAEVVGRIAAKADRESKKGQRMAALLYGCRLRQQIVPDSFYTDVARLERIKRQTADEVERAVLASVLGECYSEGVWRSRNHSERTDAHPDSVREWSRAQYLKAAADNYRLSLADPDVLASAQASDYLPFVEKGRDAAYFGGDLLNVLGRRAMRSWNTDDPDKGSLEVCALLLRTYRQRGNRQAELLVMLDSLKTATDAGRFVSSDDDPSGAARERRVLASSVYHAYRQMLSSFGDLPLAAEVYIEMVELPVTDSLKVEWAEEGYAKYKSYPRAKLLQHEIQELTAPSYYMALPEEANPDIPFEAVVRHRNLPGMELQWYHLPGGFPTANPQRAAFNKDKAAYVKKHGRLVKSQRLDWSPRPAWAEVEDTFRLVCPGLGRYVLVGKGDRMDAKGQSVERLNSSRLELIGGTLADTTSFFTVVDGRTGTPVAGATVEWKSGTKVVHAATTDSQGKVRWKGMGRWVKANGPHLWARVKKGADSCLHESSCQYVRPFQKRVEGKQRVRLYTDRAIYRPGQVVHVGGLCTVSHSGGEQVEGGRQLDLELCGPDGKTLARQQVASDALGAVSAMFTLPAKGLAGLYMVRAKAAVVRFAVEEYKRPTFEVVLDEIGHVADTLQLAGCAMGFNGVPLRGARVTGTTTVVGSVRVPASFRRGCPLDTVFTDHEGRFSLSVPVHKLDADGMWRWWARQQVDISVLASSGETQTAHSGFPLGTDRLQLSVEGLPTVVAKDSLPSICARVRTMAGTPWTGKPVEVTCDIYRTPVGQARSKVAAGLRLPANQKVRLAELASLPTGCYTLDVQAVADTDTANCVQQLKVFSLSDTRPADGVVDWFYCANDTVGPGRPGRITVGSAADSVSLYYMLFCENRVVEERLLTFSDSLLQFVYPDIPDGADGLQAVFYFVKDGQFYSYDQHVVRQRPDRSLRFSWLTFRDRLQPGQQETWRLRVTLPDGRPAPAQVMSVLYDASLDGIHPHGWNFRQGAGYALPHVSIGPFWLYGNLYLSGKELVRMPAVPALRFDHFSEKMLFGYVRNVVSLSSRQEVAFSPMAAKTVRVRGGVFDEPVADAMLEETVAEADMTEGNGGAVAAARRSAVRDDLRETAFFYPRLMADSAGVVDLQFTLPEGLTTWKFLALAHTEDMHAATFTDEVVAQKDVMAQLGLPRFVRRGDRATLTATLFNLTANPIPGAVTMEVFNPLTDETLWKETRETTLAAGADTVVAFAYAPGEGVSLPACRVTFEGGGHADGEQRYLPVLEDKEWITETRPFVVSHRGDTLIRLDGLFQADHDQADHRRLTVEYTANPLWYAVEALPSVLSPRTRDVLSLASAYYASSLTAKLTSMYPGLATAVESWAQAGGDETKSPLATNAELAGLVLEETPWVADADRGAQRANAMRQLFDANLQTDWRRQFAEALGKLQCPDGGFAWFGGMSSNTYLTWRAARLLLRSGAGRTEDKVLSGAVDVKRMVDYLMGCAHDDVVRDKEYRARHKSPLYGAAHWLEPLYLMSLCDGAWLSASVGKDADYMVRRLLEGMHELPLADKAEAAVVLHGRGKTAEAAELVRSLREHLVDGSEGLHVEYPSNGFVDSHRKIAVHTMVMEALAATNEADKATVDGLCRWLLAQKRVQDWGTSVACMDAVHALWQVQGRDLTLVTDDRVRLESARGETLVDLRTASSGSAGLGAVSARVEGTALDAGAGVLRVTKERETPSAWGAVYAQFRLPLSEVERAASGMRVRVEADNLSPRVGDRLRLRYVVTADRDYEYVCLKAGRAACLEPVVNRSGYEYRNGLGYYKDVKDASTNYFFERLPKGTYVLEAECYVERAGRYSVGAAKLNGLYAPEFSAYGGGLTIEVKP